MRIKIETIPHKKQRYRTSGDWYDKDGVTQIKVSEHGNDDYNFLIAIHELVEFYLCKKRGIKEDEVTRFDMGQDSSNESSYEGDPGVEKDAPYYWEHYAATIVEMMLAKELGVNWQEYEKIFVL